MFEEEREERDQRQDESGVNNSSNSLAILGMVSWKQQDCAVFRDGSWEERSKEQSGVRHTQGS
jgi:hypothetical protein